MVRNIVSRQAGALAQGNRSRMLGLASARRGRGMGLRSTEWITRPVQGPDSPDARPVPRTAAEPQGNARGNAGIRSGDHGVGSGAGLWEPGSDMATCPGEPTGYWVQFACLSQGSICLSNAPRAPSGPLRASQWGLSAAERRLHVISEKARESATGGRPLVLLACQPGGHRSLPAGSSSALLCPNSSENGCLIPS